MVDMNSKGLIGVPGRPRPWFGLLAATMLACGGLAGCQTQGEVAQQENSLAAAGFVVQIANTAERQAMLQRLPPNRFVVRVQDGVTHYIYADPDCGCLYVGPQQAFNQYISNQQLDLAHEQQMAGLESEAGSIGNLFLIERSTGHAIPDRRAADARSQSRRSVQPLIAIDDCGPGGRTRRHSDGCDRPGGRPAWRRPWLLCRP